MVVPLVHPQLVPALEDLPADVAGHLHVDEQVLRERVLRVKRLAALLADHRLRLLLAHVGHRVLGLAAALLQVGRSLVLGCLLRMLVLHVQHHLRSEKRR